MADELKEKVKGLYTMHGGEAAMLKEMDEAEKCPTCGGPMKATTMPEEMGPEQGGRHGRMAKLTGTDFPGYKTRKLKQGEKISGRY